MDRYDSRLDLQGPYTITGSLASRVDSEQQRLAATVQSQFDMLFRSASEVLSGLTEVSRLAPVQYADDYFKHSKLCPLLVRYGHTPSSGKSCLLLWVECFNATQMLCFGATAHITFGAGHGELVPGKGADRNEACTRAPLSV